MILGKKNNVIGLDIGSRSIKVGELAHNKNASKLKRFGMIDLAPGLIEEGNISDPLQVANTIKQLFKAYNIKDQNVALSIGGYSVIVKKINVQTMTEHQLQDTIHLEAEQYIPFDMNDVNIDFQILGESPNNPNQMNVILVAAKKDMVNNYINLVEMAGLNPCVIDVDAFALQNIYELNYPASGENVAIIDIGNAKTSLNILKDNVSVFMRDVSLGCGQINHEIVSVVDCTIDEAEQIKLNNTGEKLSKDHLQNIVTAVVTDWCDEIRRALDFFYSTYPDDQIKKIILSGGGANIEEFRSLLSEETFAEVEPINPFKNIEVDTDRFENSYLKAIAPQAAICMGLALRRVDDK
jgi:type IV pilus assembly protein PilM